jgi:hypothetical protein
MTISILSYNNINVNNKAGVFPLAEEDKALLGSNLSASASSVGGNASAPSYVPLGLSFPSESQSDKPTVLNSSNLAFLDSLSNGFLSDSLLYLIDRQMSAFDVPVPETVQNSFLKCPYIDIKFRIGIALAYIKAGMNDKADTLLSCGLGVATMNCESCGYQHPVSYNCKLRICPRCSRIRASELVAKYQPYLESLNPKRVRCITLTIKNVECLESGVSKIRRCFVKLLHRKDYKKWIKGGLYHIEATVGNDGLWHVHIHCIVVGSFIRYKRLSKDWSSITGLEFSSCSWDVWIEQKKAEATLKYCMKHLLKKMKVNDNWTPDKLVEYEMALTNVRLVQPFGCFLGVLKDYEKKPFECPRCHESIWRITSLSGETIFSPLSRMLCEYDKIKSPSTPSLCFISDG